MPQGSGGEGKPCESLSHLAGSRKGEGLQGLRATRTPSLSGVVLEELAWPRQAMAGQGFQGRDPWTLRIPNPSMGAKNNQASRTLGGLTIRMSM